MKHTPFHENHIKAGGTMGPVGEWLGPMVYSNAVDEHEATRKRVTSIDFSMMCKFMIQGKDAKAFAQYILVNDVDKLFPGKAFYSAMCDEAGNFVDDITLYMIEDNCYMMIGGIPAREKNAAWLKQHAAGFEIVFTDVTSAYGILSVAGPLSRALFKKICDPIFLNLSFFEFCKITIGGHSCFLSRTGVTGELGYEVIANAEDCYDIYEAIYDAGAEYGIQPCGLAASGTLRMEKGYISGREFLGGRNPYEMGLGWSVALNTNFIGHEALKAVKENGMKNKLCAIRIADKNIIAPAGAHVLLNEKEVGIITSTAWLPTMDISYAMVIMDAKYVEIGADVCVELTDHSTVTAEIIEKNLYDPTASRIKA